MLALFPSEKLIQVIIDGFLRIVLRQQCSANSQMKKEEELFYDLLTVCHDEYKSFFGIEKENQDLFDYFIFQIIP